MNISLLMNMILNRLGRDKFKTFLMGLGIAVSVSTMVLIQTGSVGIRDAFSTFIERVYPADSVWLMAGSGLMGQGKVRSSNLRLVDVETVSHSLPDIIQWDPIVQGEPRDIKYGGQNVLVGITGVSDKAEQVRRRGVVRGEFFSFEEVRDKARVVLLGTTTAKKLFASESAIGSQIFIDSIPFTVKGILESIGVNPHGADGDDTVYIPYTTLMDDILHIDNISGVTFIVKDRHRVETVAVEIKKIIRDQHQLSVGQEDDFSVVTPVLVQALLDKSFKIFNIFIPLIAGTAFLLSGLVVLGIMLIIIKKRTSEIGLKKALGARQIDVQVEFLLEVTIVAVVSALVGLIIAEVAIIALKPMLAQKFGITDIRTSTSTMFVAMIASIFTGLLGALFPARQASRLRPVEALK